MTTWKHFIEKRARLDLGGGGMESSSPPRNMYEQRAHNMANAYTPEAATAIGDSYKAEDAAYTARRNANRPDALADGLAPLGTLATGAAESVIGTVNGLSQLMADSIPYTYGAVQGALHHKNPLDAANETRDALGWGKAVDKGLSAVGLGENGNVMAKLRGLIENAANERGRRIGGELYEGPVLARRAGKVGYGAGFAAQLMGGGAALKGLRLLKVPRHAKTMASAAGGAMIAPLAGASLDHVQESYRDHRRTADLEKFHDDLMDKKRQLNDMAERMTYVPYNDDYKMDMTKKVFDKNYRGLVDRDRLVAALRASQAAAGRIEQARSAAADDSVPSWYRWYYQPGAL